MCKKMRIKSGTRLYLKYLDVEIKRGKVPKSLMPQLPLNLGHIALLQQQWVGEPDYNFEGNWLSGTKY